MNSSRNRKIAYLLAIVVLFTGLIGVSGWIERVAEERHLAQKTLGKVNPVSGTAQMVLMGFRGVAVTFLWHDVIALKREERWFEIRPVLESITLLQPNFIEPWTFQAWNMAYNIAAEWEAVKDKYYWIRQGIDFMKNATITNRNQCDLEWEVGWLYHNRFGMTDEKTYLRQMFKEDKDDAFSLASSGIRDNFEKAYDWFVQANRTVEGPPERKPKRRGITPFMCYPALTKTSYADFLGKDGIFHERNKNAWRTAHEEWLSFGRKGGPGRYAFIHKLDYTAEERSKLNEEERYWADRYAKTVNYYYWKRRTRLEATPDMQMAREAYYKANQAHRSGDYQTAIAEYEKAFPPWRKVLEENENLRIDDAFIEESQEQEDRYLRLLSRLDLPLPKKRPFEGMYDPLTPDPLVTEPDLQRKE